MSGEKVEGVKPGIYHYDAGGHRLQTIAYGSKAPKSRDTWLDNGGFAMPRSSFF